MKYPGFGDVKVGYNRFSVFAVIFGLMFCLTLQAWLPVWAHKFGEFPGKGSKETWKRANYYAMEGQRARKEKNNDQSIILYDKAIQIYPHDGDYFLGRGLAFESRRKQGDLQKAEKDFRKSADLSPEQWETWECIGQVLYELGRKSECEPMFLKAIACNPPNKSKARIEKNIDTVRKEVANQ